MEYNKVEHSIDGAILLYSKYKCSKNKIKVIEKEVWRDGCTTYDCTYKGYDFFIYHYKKDNNVEMRHNETSEKGKRALDELDFIFYYDEIQERLKGI
ncbi:MAG: hypothetical protein MSA15_21360 [Clostridium sp.]|nr:hypothetical protein [Clostridium sp.]